jgi:Uma2 family endonuclease
MPPGVAAVKGAGRRPSPTLGPAAAEPAASVYGGAILGRMSAGTVSTLPRRRFTVDEVSRMVQDGILHEDERLELLDGDLVLVSPQGPRHAAQVAELLARLAAAYSGKAHVRPQLPLDLRPYNLPEPDVAVVPGAPRDYRDRHPSGRDAWLVVEIAQTSHDVDRRKAAIYAAGGVEAYWLLDLPQQRLEVHSQPADVGGYRQHVVLAAGEEVELPRLGVRWMVAGLVD